MSANCFDGEQISMRALGKENMNNSCFLYILQSYVLMILSGYWGVASKQKPHVIWDDQFLMIWQIGVEIPFFITQLRFSHTVILAVWWQTLKTYDFHLSPHSSHQIPGLPDHLLQLLRTYLWGAFPHSQTQRHLPLYCHEHWMPWPPAIVAPAFRK